MIDEAWLKARLAEAAGVESAPGPAVGRLREVLAGLATGFATARADVQSAEVTWPRRGLHEDEAASFLRAVDAGLAVVDGAGYVTVSCARAKTPPGRYALFSRSGAGVALNLEYLVQIGATAELVLDHGWPADRVEFERGEFDALTYGLDSRVVIAMEAKARATGADSLEYLVRSWLAHDPVAPANNASRKYRELVRFCESGPVTVWLVAAGARWTLQATRTDTGVDLSPNGSIERGAHDMAGRELLWTQPYDSTLHRAGTRGAEGKCSWLCPEPAAFSTRVVEAGGGQSTFSLCGDHQARVEAVYAR